MGRPSVRGGTAGPASVTVLRWCRNHGATGVVAVALLALYLPVIWHAAQTWSVDEEFSFGFLVPPITLALLWHRRQDFCQACHSGSGGGLLPLVGGLLLLVVSARSGIHALGGVSCGLTILGALTYLYGWAAGRVVLGPLAFVALSLSLYRGLLNDVGFTLQGLTARYAAQAAALLGVPVRHSGVDLFVGPFHFVVAEACSGLRPLLALLCLGTLLVSLMPLSAPRRLTVLTLILPIVLLANVGRVTLVLVLARTYGVAVAQGFIHGLFSATLFLLALTLFVLVGRFVQWVPPIGVTASSSD